LEGSKATEELALERAAKANEICESLHKEIEVERQSSASLESQVTLLSKRLEDASALGLSTAELYASMVGQFGGITPTLPEEPSAYNLFCWLKSNFVKLPDLIGRAMDFGTLASATNFLKMLGQIGCLHKGRIWAALLISEKLRAAFLSLSATS
jgi:hypothetical protein